MLFDWVSTELCGKLSAPYCTSNYAVTTILADVYLSNRLRKRLPSKHEPRIPSCTWLVDVSEYTM